MSLDDGGYQQWSDLNKKKVFEGFRLLGGTVSDYATGRLVKPAVTYPQAQRIPWLFDADLYRSYFSDVVDRCNHLLEHRVLPETVLTPLAELHDLKDAVKPVTAFLTYKSQDLKPRHRWLLDLCIESCSARAAGSGASIRKDADLVFDFLSKPFDPAYRGILKPFETALYHELRCQPVLCLAPAETRALCDPTMLDNGEPPATFHARLQGTQPGPLMNFLRGLLPGFYQYLFGPLNDRDISVVFIKRDNQLVGLYFLGQPSDLNRVAKAIEALQDPLEHITRDHNNKRQASRRSFTVAAANDGDNLKSARARLATEVLTGSYHNLNDICSVNNGQWLDSACNKCYEILRTLNYDEGQAHWAEKVLGNPSAYPLDAVQVAIGLTKALAYRHLGEVFTIDLAGLLLGLEVNVCLLEDNEKTVISTGDYKSLLPLMVEVRAELHENKVVTWFEQLEHVVKMVKDNDHVSIEVRIHLRYPLIYVKSPAAAVLQIVVAAPNDRWRDGLDLRKLAGEDGDITAIWSCFRAMDDCRTTPAGVRYWPSHSTNTDACRLFDGGTFLVSPCGGGNKGQDARMVYQVGGDGTW